MIRLRWSALERVAPGRPAGYLADCLDRGSYAGGYLWLSEADYLAIRQQYPVNEGLGDTFAAMAKPIAGALDAILQTDLANCGGCAQRRAWLNEHFPAPESPLKLA